MGDLHEHPVVDRTKGGDEIRHVVVLFQELRERGEQADRVRRPVPRAQGLHAWSLPPWGALRSLPDAGSSYQAYFLKKAHSSSVALANPAPEPMQF